jgi:hypothetical protein
MALVSRGELAPVQLARLRTVDRDNGLYVYLAMLDVLRQENGDSEETDGGDGLLLGLLDGLRRAGPARLYISRQHVVAASAFHETGLSPRESAALAERIRWSVTGLHERHGPVLRELAERLTARGTSWREAGRVPAAMAAHAAVVRLLTDVLEDSPVPDVAMLATERLPAGLRELELDAISAGQASLAEACETQKRDVAAFRARWREVASGKRVNLLPYTADIALARPAQDRVLRSLSGAFVCAGSWLTLAIACLAWLAVAGLARPAAERCPVWRWHGRGIHAGAAVVCIPVLGTLAVLIGADVRFTWLLSYPSLPALAVWPVGTLMLVGLACWLFARPAEKPEGSAMPAAVVGSFAMLVALTVAAGAWLLPLYREDWRPPAGVQVFRQLGVILAAEWFALIIVWSAWSSVRRRRVHVPTGAWSRVNLGLGSVSLLWMTLLAMALLGVNQHFDRVHQEAFARAAADPVADLLGESWWEDDFAGVRVLLDKVEPGLERMNAPTS